MKKNSSYENSRVDDTVSALLESLPDSVYIIDLKGVILNTNTLFASQFGKRPAECIGANIYDLITTVLQLPELASHHKEKCKEVLRTGKRVSFADERDIRKVTISPVLLGNGEITRLLITIQNLAEQKRLELELKSRLPRYNYALEAAHAGVWEWNLKTNDIIWSKDIWKLYGIEQGDEEPTFEFWESIVHPDDREMTIQTIKTVASNSQELNIEYRFFSPDGSIYWMMSRGKPVLDNNGQATHYFGTIIDVTERKKMELELIESKKKYSFALDAASSGIWEWDVKTDKLSWSEQVWGLYGLQVNSLPLNNQLCIDTIHPDDREMASWIIRDAVSNSNPATLEYRTCHPDGSVHWLTSRGMPLLDAEGNVASYIGTIIDITGRKQTESELIETEERLKFALEATSTGVWEWDVIEDKVTWTDNVWKLYGLEKNTLPHTHRLCESNIHPDDRDFLFEKVMAAASKEIDIDIEYRVCHKGGSIHWLKCQGVPKYNTDGRLTSYIGTVTDISSRKELMNRLLDSKRLLSQALDAAHAGVWEWNLKTGENIWSEETWRLYGLERGDKTPSFDLWASTIYPDDRNMVIGTVSSAAENQTPLYIEYRISNYKGSERWLMSRGKPIYDKYGKVERYIGTIIDISERKAIEEKLKISQERLDFVLESSHVGVWDLNMQDGSSVRTIEHARIFGYETIPPLWSFEKFIGHIIPEDRPAVESLIRSSIEKKENYTFECRIHSVKGELRWITVTGACKFDKNCKSNNVLGIIQDITEQKLDQNKIIESEEKFRTIFNRSPIAIGIGDFSAGIMYDVNPAWLQLFGFTREEVIGRSIKDLLLYENIEDDEQILKELKEHRQIINKLFHLRNKSGDTATILFSSDFIPLNDKQALLVMMTDITMQELQQGNIERLEQIVDDRTRQLKDEVKHLNSFLHMISHEYRTPLAIIRGNLDLIELKNKHSNCVNTLELTKIRRAIDRLVEVMEQSMHEARLLEFSSVFPLKPVQLLSLITSQAESFRALWPDQAIEYSVTVEACEILGDPSRLKLAIFNLLDNAHKYSLPGSTIELKSSEEGESAVISIRNKGIPLLEDEAEVIFEKYQRGSNSMNTGGAGLGLWMVKSIIEEHKGQVSLKGFDSGVEVTIRLPLFHHAL